jgi:hypothetical protein
VIDLRSWGKNWNDAALERIAAALPRRSESRPWPMFGMLALGLVAGVAIGGYAMSQRSQMKRQAGYAHRMGDELGRAGEPQDDPQDESVAVTTHRSNHRRKATSEV